MRTTAKKIIEYKEQGKKITALTAYDYSSAKYFDKAGVDIILVGDSLAEVALGYSSTTQVTLDEMLIFTQAVARGAKNALVVADMPFMSYQISVEEAVKNAGKFIQAGAQAVKIEGSNTHILETIKHLTQNGIPVMGHLGFTPQYINTIGGHFVSAKDSQKTFEILNMAQSLEKAGVFSIVLEMVPQESSKFITQRLNVPTIGIGAGRYCDGQILVSDDILGKYDEFCPKFARQYSSLKDIIFNVARAYCNDVEKGNFPSIAESFTLDTNEAQKLENYSQD